MKKTFTLFLTCMVAILSSMAQSTARRAVPRPAAPGVNFRMPIQPYHVTAKPQKPVKSLKSTATKVRPVKRLVEDVAGNTPYDTLLVTKMHETENGEEVRRTEITYDQYGLRKTMLEYGENGRLNNSYRYTYTVGAFNYWTEKLVECMSDDEPNVFKPYQRVEREIDDHKHLVREKLYSWMWNNETHAEEFNLEEDVKYDYAHPFKNGYDDEVTYGHPVEEILDYGTFKKSYAWFEPARQYVCTRVETNGRCETESSFGEDYVKKVVYEYDYDYVSDSYSNPWVFREEYYYFTEGEETGFTQIEYNHDGGVWHAEGSKRVIEKDKPSAGYVTETYYELDHTTLEFVPLEKTETLGNIELYLGYAESREYEFRDGEWELYSEYKHELFKRNIYKVTQGEYEYYVAADEEGEAQGSVQINGDGSYVFITLLHEETPDGETLPVNYYTTYDASGNIIREIKRIPMSNDPLLQHPTEDFFSYYIKEGDTWKIMNEYETNMPLQGFNMRVTYSFTPEGYPSYINIHVTAPSINDGKEFLEKQTKYTYTDNGYTVEKYETIFFGIKPKLILSEKDEYLLLADGTYQETSYEYDEEDSSIITYATRMEENDGIIKHYSYSNGAFVLNHAYCYNLETVTEDGTKTVIERRLDEDNTTVINIRKTETKEGETDHGQYTEAYQFMTSYKWDEEENKWVGEYKENRKSAWLRGFSTAQKDPIAQYSDEYLDMEIPSTRVDEILLNARTSYTWDYQHETWASNYSEDYDIRYEGDNKLTYSVVTQNEYSKREETSVYERNERHQVTKKIWTCKESNVYDPTEEPAITTETTSYTYNPNGYPEIRTYVTEDNSGNKTTNVLRYEYTQHSVYPTSIEIVTTEGKPAITVADGYIRSANGETICLFDAQGRLIASGQGSVQVTVPGIYVVRTDSGSVKVAVK